MCHFCKQKVYLMEKISVENLILHRACLKCHHCHTSLRLGGYAFDRDDPNGRFYCTQHYRMPAKIVRPTPKRTSLSRGAQKTNVNVDGLAMAGARDINMDKVEEFTPKRRDGLSNLDLLDRGNVKYEHFVYI